jgi:hypothetical protein
VEKEYPISNVPSNAQQQQEEEEEGGEEEVNFKEENVSSLSPPPPPPPARAKQSPLVKKSPGLLGRIFQSPGSGRSSDLVAVLAYPLHF